jgi:glycosyltransferase involved in cell wall biosynthesis
MTLDLIIWGLWPLVMYGLLCAWTLFMQLSRASSLPEISPANSVPLPGAWRVAVLIPAHNESAGIERTLDSIRSQLGTEDFVLVVADNCSDDTAGRAQATGAMVTERFHAEQRGKGYALAHGVECLRPLHPTHVLVIDADCQLHPGSLNELKRAASDCDSPLQACDLMHAPAGSPISTRIAEFAWLVKNDLRPTGGARMGWPCQLMGTGMMFPWPLLEKAPLATGHVAEDLNLGIHLGNLGHYPLYCRTAKVTSWFPVDGQAALNQRKRWEHGHLSVILDQALPMCWRAIQRRDWRMLGMALDMSVPPLAALVLMLGVPWVLTLVIAVLADTGWGTWLTLSLANGLLLAAIVRAWRLEGHRILTVSDLLRLPLYIMGKLSIYGNFISRKRATWVRAARDGEQHDRP